MNNRQTYGVTMHGMEVTPQPTAKDVLSKYSALTEKVAIIVPSTVNATVQADFNVVNEWKDGALSLLSELFGGATAYNAQGGWVSDVHGLIKEDVTVVYANASEVTGDDMTAVVQFAQRMSISLQQECIAVEYNGALHFIGGEF